VQLYRCFVSQSSEFCLHNPLSCFSTSVCCYFVTTQSGNFWIHVVQQNSLTWTHRKNGGKSCNETVRNYGQQVNWTDGRLKEDLKAMKQAIYKAGGDEGLPVGILLLQNL